MDSDNRGKSSGGSGLAARINAWCNGLSHRQRIRFILILSAIYLLMAVAVLLWIWMDEGGTKRMDFRHIRNPIPVLKHKMKSINPAPADSISTQQNEKTDGKDR